MNEADKIKTGDIVRVDFNGSQITLSFKAELLKIPIVTGDSWVFKDERTGFINYVSEGCTISKRIEE